MTAFVALLRGVNVGGTGLLPMKQLSAMCTNLGFENVRTYIQSGNVIFQSKLSEERIQTDLEQALAAMMCKHVAVIIRTADELRSILDANPFRGAEPAKVAVVFFIHPVPNEMVDDIITPGREEVRRGTREIYIHYPDGMGRSKLKLPRGMPSTTRNINTVAKLVAMTTT